MSMNQHVALVSTGGVSTLVAQEAWKWCKSAYLSRDADPIVAQPYYPSQTAWGDDYDYNGEYGQRAYFTSKESQAVIYTFVAAFMGWVVRGCTNIK